MRKREKNKSMNYIFFYKEDSNVKNIPMEDIMYKEVLDYITEEDIYNYEQELGIIDIFNSTHKIPF